MPLISVIVPVYKVEKFLNRCVDSILRQSFNDFELILVDDGSPDQCGNICEEYAKKDDRITVIHQKNAGLSAARNAGIDWSMKNSDSEWLTFVDSDDWVHKEYLDVLYRAVEITGLKFAIGGFERTEGHMTEIAKEDMQPRVWKSRDFFIQHNLNAVLAWGKLYSKEDFRDIRYPVGRIHEDEFTTYKILFRYDQIVAVDVPLYAYYQNPTGIIGSKASFSRMDFFDMLEERLMYFLKMEDMELYQITYKWMLKELYDRLLMGDAIPESVFKDVRRRYRKALLKYEKRNIFFKGMRYYRELFAIMHPEITNKIRKLKGTKKD